MTLPAGGHPCGQHAEGHASGGDQIRVPTGHVGGLPGEIGEVVGPQVLGRARDPVGGPFYGLGHARLLLVTQPVGELLGRRSELLHAAGGPQTLAFGRTLRTLADGFGLMAGEGFHLFDGFGGPFFDRGGHSWASPPRRIPSGSDVS